MFRAKSRLFHLGAALLASILVLPALADAKAPFKPLQTGYAEGLYADYAAASDHTILFEIETLERGRLAELGGTSFGELISVPGHRIDASESGLAITNLALTKNAAEGHGAHDLGFTPADLEEVGYPVEMGTFRKLQVGVSLGDEILTHQAIELCWQEIDHCYVVDPVIVFLDSIVQENRRLRAEGWGPKVLVDRSATTKASCGLASSPSHIGISYTWGAYTRTYKNVYGMTLVTKNLGSQQSAIRCNSSCDPAPYGYSNSSSCSGTLGWTCACDNAFGVGITGSTGKWIAETRCTHKFTFSAKASASVTNYGSASVDINWTLGGGVDGNGGQIVDSCGYF